MVALLGLFDALEVGVEVLLCEPGGAVDALEHGAVGVAAPVRAGDLQQLERADAPGRGHVGASAQIGERALRVGGDRLGLGKLLDELALVRLLLERVPRLELVELGALEGLLLGDDLAHPLFDGLEVFRRERATDVEVVVEAVLDGGADAELGHREQVLDRLGHHVGRRVTQDVQRFGALVGDDLDRIAVGDRLVHVGELPVDLRRDRGLAEARSDGGGNVENRRALGNRFRAAVGKRHGDLRHMRAPLEIWSRPDEAGRGSPSDVRV